jgi:hypothetical protein
MESSDSSLVRVPGPWQLSLIEVGGWGLVEVDSSVWWEQD